MDAFGYYHERSVSAAEGFKAALQRAHDDIQKMPDTWANYHHGTRRYLLSKYPYVVVYRITTERIEIIAVAHGHRKPGYWADRLEPK